MDILRYDHVVGHTMVHFLLPGAGDVYARTVTNRGICSTASY